MTFRLDDRNDCELHSDSTGLRQPSSMHCVATATVTVLDRRDQDIVVRIQGKAIEFLDAKNEPIRNDAQQQRFVEAAQSPLCAKLHADGSILAYRFVESLDGQQRTFLRGMANILLLPAPSSSMATGSRWIAHEADTSGEFESSAAVIGTDSSTTSVRRQKIRYTSMVRPECLPDHRVGGAAIAAFHHDVGWLSSVRLDETLTLAVPVIDLQAEHHRVAEVDLIDFAILAAEPSGPGLWDAPWATATGVDDPPSDQSLAIAQERRYWEKRLAGVTLEQLIDELQRILAIDPPDSDALGSAFNRLQWLVRLSDPVAGEIVAQVLQGLLSKEVARVALLALGAAGTHAAQQALATMLGDRSLEPAVREAGTVSLLQLEHPEPGLFELLHANLQRGADGWVNDMLVLGGLTSRASSPLAAGGSVLESLLAMEDTVRERGQTAQWLRALGNSGRDETLAVATRYLDDADEEIRAAALRSLRDVNGGAATQTLVERGLQDRDPFVRIMALDTLARRSDAASAEAVRLAAIGDSDPEVRLAAVQALAGSEVQDDIQVLQRIASSDSDPGLRSAAARALRRGA